MNPESAILPLLPPRLREIAGVVGVDAALKLAAAKGGLRLHVPARLTAEHPIAQVIGLEAGHKLCQHYGGEEFALPRGLRYRRHLVRVRALERYYGGEPAGSVAGDMGLHEITIYNWAGADKKATAQQQPTLF